MDNDAHTDDCIDEYLRRARQQWPQGEPVPQQDRLRTIAADVDMSVEDSEQADRRARDLASKAGELLDDGDTEGAESLLRDAILLSPVRLQPFYLLARIYAERYGRHGRDPDRQIGLDLARRAQELDHQHAPTRQLIENLGDHPQDSISWGKAALIVAVLVLISGTMHLCNNHFLAPEVTDEQTEEVRQYLEEHGEPPR